MPSRELREVAADWVMLIGAVALFVSLFLTWSHQLSPAFAAQWRGALPLAGVARNPTAWQVYTGADVLLAVVALALAFVAALGGRRVRLVVLVAVALAIAFTLHALAVPPTNGVDLAAPAAAAPAYVADAPAAGVGETVALAALGLGLAGLLLSLTVD